MSDDRPAFKSWLDSLRDELIGPCPPNCLDCSVTECECDSCSGDEDPGEVIEAECAECAGDCDECRPAQIMIIPCSCCGLPVILRA